MFFKTEILVGIRKVVQTHWVELSFTIWSLNFFRFLGPEHDISAVLFSSEEGSGPIFRGNLACFFLKLLKKIDSSFIVCVPRQWPSFQKLIYANGYPNSLAYWSTFREKNWSQPLRILLLVYVSFIFLVCWFLIPSWLIVLKEFVKRRNLLHSVTFLSRKKNNVL